MRLLPVLAPLLLATLLAPAAAGAALPTADRLDRLADAAVATGIPAVVVVARDGARTVSAASGRAARDRRAPIRTSALFRVASLTKPMTAVVLLRLAEEDRLGLDDLVERWVPGVLPAGSTVTVRELLDHTASLGEYYDPAVILKPYLEGNVDFRWRPLDLVRRGVAQPAARPRGRFGYTDTGYVLAGLVAEAAGDAPFATLLRRFVTGPLRLTDTSYPLGGSTPRGLARGYADAGGRRLTDVTRLSPSIAHASGAVVSSARDLLDFERALLGGRLLRPASLAAMRVGVPMGGGLPADDRYGLGLWRTARFALLSRPTACGQLEGHNGAYPGYSTNAFSGRGGRRQFALLATTDSLGARQSAALARLARVAAC